MGQNIMEPHGKLLIYCGPAVAQNRLRKTAPLFFMRLTLPSSSPIGPKNQHFLLLAFCVPFYALVNSFYPRFWVMWAKNDAVRCNSFKSLIEELRQSL